MEQYLEITGWLGDKSSAGDKSCRETTTRGIRERSERQLHAEVEDTYDGIYERKGSCAVVFTLVAGPRNHELRQMNPASSFGMLRRRIRAMMVFLIH
jgi:hypothetical protein